MPNTWALPHLGLIATVGAILLASRAHRRALERVWSADRQLQAPG